MQGNFGGLQVDMATLERDLMEEGVQKFANPQKESLALVAQQRSSPLASSGREGR